MLSDEKLESVFNDALVDFKGGSGDSVAAALRAVAEAAVKDAVGGEPVGWQYRETRDDGTWSAWIGCCVRLEENEYRQCRALYTSPQASAAVPDATGAGFPELCELMRGLEIPPSALSLGPRGLYLIGKAIADQAKEANEEL